MVCCMAVFGWFSLAACDGSTPRNLRYPLRLLTSVSPEGGGFVISQAAA